MEANSRFSHHRFVGALILISVLFWPQGVLFAVTYKSTAEDGTLHFVCDSSCGRVRVKKTDRNRYRVFSIGYSGDLVADSEKQAARKACGEMNITGSKRVSPKPSRGGSGC
ncbi:MAG: hypothetical protein HN590_09840 [Calditrichaeota bacterium]|jgi:hypothetical protein|nr:hypothetical protein [Deltaproteobacteria bacterium]MBT7617570.1 hypothetical protein [Calditrichota bacterium]MBT4266259.1 hypothetical protein [Deltaproteobacteria bacterium]MBT4639970.1 hypothetical protein [Deltaproteobacteria bacterium]MBT6503802.1 hypothetical protein [Deltaproteobacteria bacterium]